VQLRLVDGRPVPFELNVRFSGTTPMRVQLGFNEVEAALRHFVLGEDELPLADVEEGVVLRYWNEMYVSSEAAAELQDGGELKDPRAHARFTEPWGGT
jgi:carbamoyl-phosphate synthase large subunit